MRSPRFLKWSVLAALAIAPFFGAPNTARAAEDDDIAQAAASAPESDKADAGEGSAVDDAEPAKADEDRAAPHPAKKAHAKKAKKAKAVKVAHKKDKKHKDKKSASHKVAQKPKKASKDGAKDKHDKVVDAEPKLAANDVPKKKSVALSKPATDSHPKDRVTTAEGGDPKHRLRKKVKRHQKPHEE